MYTINNTQSTSARRDNLLKIASMFPIEENVLKLIDEFHTTPLYQAYKDDEDLTSELDFLVIESLNSPLTSSSTFDSFYKDVTLKFQKYLKEFSCNDDIILGDDTINITISFDDKKLEGIEYDMDPLASMYRTELKDIIKTLLDTLTLREKYIIKERYLGEKKKSLNKISLVLNVTPERVRQIEHRALFKLRRNNYIRLYL